jgi:hypothetical protein
MIRSLIGIALALVAVAPSARAVDLTGTWEGTVTCTAFNGEYSKTKVADSVLLILQSASGEFTALLDGMLGFNGRVVDSTAKPEVQGEAVMTVCSTDAVPIGGGDDEIARLKVKVNPVKGTGTLSGESIVTTQGTILTCKYKHKRTSPTSPKVSSCSA